MDLSENRNQHPNLIMSAVAHQCVIGATTYDHSIIIPSNEAVIKTAVQTTDQLDETVIEQLVSCASPSRLIKPKLQEMSEIIGRIKEDLFNKVHFNRSCYQIMFSKPCLLSSRGRMACHLCWLS